MKISRPTLKFNLEAPVYMTKNDQMKFGLPQNNGVQDHLLKGFNVVDDHIIKLFAQITLRATHHMICSHFHVAPNWFSFQTYDIDEIYGITMVVIFTSKIY